MDDIDHIDIVNIADIDHSCIMAMAPIYTVKKLVALTPEMMEAISAYRFANRIGAEAEAIRRLIALGLKAAEKDSAAQ